MRNLRVESNLYYDDFLAQINFEENFKRINNTDSFIFIDFGNLSDDFAKEDFFIIDYEKTKKRDINKLKVYLLDGRCFKDYSLKELIYEFLGGDDLIGLETLLNDYNITYKKAYADLYISGYNQGDEAQIFVNLSEYKKVTGNDFIEDDYKIYFSNLFYDTPIIGEFNISFDYTTKNGINHTYNFFKDDEFYTDEYLNNSYELDFNFDYIFNTINKDLIQYELNEDEKNEIIKELNKLDYTDIRDLK